MTFESPVLQLIWTRKLAFLVTFFIVFTLSYGFLALIDFLPEPPTTHEEIPVTPTTAKTVTESVTTAPVVDTTTQVSPTEPITLTIPSLDRTVTIANPITADIPTLDKELLKGVVRHPDSGLLGEDGNILILGHSSYLPVVHNKSFQALNGIQKMEWGDTIELTGNGMTYTYRVEKVYQAKASTVTIPTMVKGQHLTLVTCNNFGAKEDRYIVEATLVAKVAKK
jgi:LPXTG-site transpeptidase (sortase) family protein